MTYNFVNDDAQISLAEGCFHDTKNGYSSDFSTNGNVDGWTVYNGIHLYGAWGGYLFGTYHETSGYIGRASVFIAIPAEYFYTVKIVMKVNPINSTGNTRIPTKGKIRWRTLTNTFWDTNKELEFDVIADNKWRSYILNMGPEYYWQGDVNDLRIYPLTDAVPDNEFFIRSIKIQSVQTFRCTNYDCSYYSQYTHPCPAVGSKTSITSEINDRDMYVVSVSNNEFTLDMNGYGKEIFEIPTGNYTGQELAKTLATEFSKISMGGYAEVNVTYSDRKEFIIKSGMLGNETTVVVHDSSLARYIKFYDSAGTASYITVLGSFPATGFRPKSSFMPSTFQLLGMFDNKENTSFEFDPGRYAIEGGRSDILANGFGDVSITDGDPDAQRSGAFEREYGILYNYGKTIIDFSHPFNSSGNIKKIFLACTYDTGTKDENDNVIFSKGNKVIIFRPQKDGLLKSVATVKIQDKNETPTKLYSTIQETLEIDCDIWVGRGDLIGVYNINLYAGKVVFGSGADASYYQLNAGVASDDNVALNKLASMSSRYHGTLFNAEDAVDGDISGNSYAHTSNEAGAWWKVDLGEEYDISRIRIQKRAGFGVRPENYYIQSADDYDFTTNVVNMVTAINETSEDITYTYSVDFTVNKARYLRIITHTSSQYINLAEFSVYTFSEYGDPGAGSAFDPGKLLGNGNAGLLVYARADYVQQALEMDVDLQKRVNIDSIVLDGESKVNKLEFNVARCLDVNWQADLFGGQYATGYYDSWNSVWKEYTHNSVAYGLDTLDDGIYSSSGGLTADYYSVAGTDPVVSQGNHYFYVNGDEEWLGIYHHVPSQYLSSPYVEGFTEDPIAIYLHFPFNKKKYIYKSAIYFKERWNFRNLALSYYLGSDRQDGNADHYSYQLIDKYDAITTDGVRYTEGTTGYDNVDDYLFQNPTYGKSIRVQTGVDSDGFGRGYIDNYEAFLEMQYTDWNIIKHEFGPILAGGFRIYTDLHYSTKINEIELFCIVDDTQASLSSGFELMHSHYGSLWWPLEVSDLNNKQATAQVDDTPRYVNIVVEPISKTEIYNITFTVNSGDVYVGKKGCKYEVFPIEAKTESNNDASIIYLKNVYDKNFNLFVDIAKESKKEDSLIFYSKMNNAASIDNPEVGPGGRYVKNSDNLLRNSNNCAINCPVYGLKNLIDGKNSYYSEDDGATWTSSGTLSGNQYINFENIPTGYMTTGYPTVTYRERYWRFASKWTEVDIDIHEFKVFDEYGVEIPATWYHDKGISVTNSPATDTAPHLSNGSVRGSYYTLTTDDYITLDFGSPKAIHELTFWHQDTGYYTTTVDVAGIDPYIALCLNGWSVEDASYFRHQGTNNGVTVVPSPTTISGLSGISSSVLYFDGSSSIEFPEHGEWDFSVVGWIKYSFEARFSLTRLPNDGEEFVIVECGTDGYEWRCVIRGESGNTHITFLVKDINYPLNDTSHNNYLWSSASTGEWHHVLWYAASSVYSMYFDGVKVWNTSTSAINFGSSDEPVTVGRNMHGYMEEIRVSKIGRAQGVWTIPFQSYATIEMYSSMDNITYGKYMDFDLSAPGNTFNDLYNVYFAIDLAKRYDLDIVRSYGNSNVANFSLTNNVCFSAAETTTPSIAFDSATCTPDILTHYSMEKITGNDVVVDESSTNHASLWFGSGDITDGHDGVHGTKCIYIYRPTTEDPYFEATNLFNREKGAISVWVKTTKSAEQYIFCTSGHNYILTWSIRHSFGIRGDGSIWMSESPGSGNSQTPTTNVKDGNWHHIVWSWADDKGKRIWLDKQELELSNNYGGFQLDSPMVPRRVMIFRSTYYGASHNQTGYYGYVDEFMAFHKDLTTADVENLYDGPPYGGENDARWVFLKQLNGDGENRIISKVGVYPKIQTLYAPGGGRNNTEWDNLGTDITTYVGETNIASGATVSGSSTFYGLYTNNITNGSITGGFDDIWGSDDSSTQSVNIDLGSVKKVFKFIIHHGLDISTSDYMIHGYNIYTSEDDITYTARFTITGNTAHERLHQLVDSVYARYIRIDINHYSFTTVYRPISQTQYGWFSGAVLREVEVFEDYGYDKISSEEYPIICTNMNYQFYIDNVTLSGMNPTDPSTDWSTPYYAFSDSIIDDPEKVDFGVWDGPYDFEKWVAVKNNSATELNGGPDYLKHILVKSTEELNPCDHSKWWHSNISTLSEDYTYVKKFSTSSIKIEYPASSGIENIYFYEGDDFGIDGLASWRDGFSFWWYIDDINNFDIDYGYFKFGGYDNTNDTNKVEYRWNYSTLSGSLSSGWNDLFLRFKNADSIIYTDPVEMPQKDVRIPSTVTLKTIGYTFRGKGNPITMYWNGFGIVRNAFQDYSVFDNGLYLTENDLLTCPLNELDLSRGTIEFNLRTDYDYRAKGLYDEFVLRSLFHITNSANDVLGAMFSERGLQVYYGNVDEKMYYFGISDITYIDIDTMFNIAFVFSNTGEHIDSDGSTIRVYIDNTLIGKTTEKWNISDNKYFKFIFGGKALLSLKEESFTAETHSVDGVVGNLKVYNYCKTDFSDVINNEVVATAGLKKPSELIEISKDNLTFYKVGSENLPLSFDLVVPGTIVPIYVRPTIPGDLTGAERRTASIVAEWDVTV